jgi:predicted metalloprotease with PDZ domain
MNTFARMTALALLASLTSVFLSSSPASAAQPNALLLPPGPDYCLPKFGFSSFNVSGVGERVTNVRWGGIAARMGVEPGDMILSMNGFPLTYHGAWSDALYRAMARGSWVQLKIRDVRAGHIAFRQIYLGDRVGSVTPKYHVGIGNGPNVSHATHHDHDYDDHHHHGPMGANKLKQIAKLFED